ncbi:MAG: hypothetical protein QOE05_1438 [Actinomycetota bacterium]|jgi:hypothetical protein|nr:hypothetical protein [Actinomycetota bacterium]
MTMTSPTHALACARVCDMLRTAAASRRVPPRQRRRLVRSATAGALHWLRLGQLGVVNPCTDC